MALGTPVVASCVAGLPEALEGGCGVLVEPRDSSALAYGLSAMLLCHPAGRRALADRARARVEERFDARRNGAALAALLRNTRRKGPADHALVGPSVISPRLAANCDLVQLGSTRAGRALSR